MSPDDRIRLKHMIDAIKAALRLHRIRGDKPLEEAGRVETLEAMIVE